MAIKILVDSASDISLKEAKEMGIELISMQITFNNEDYLDGVDLLPREFYEKLIESDTLPKTSQINPFRFSEVFENLVNEGNEVIAIVLSSKLSSSDKVTRFALAVTSVSLRSMPMLADSNGDLPE